MINLHNHSTWSDGRHAPAQLAQAAAVSGLSHVGISDHFYTDKLFPSCDCVDVDRLEGYVADLRRVAARHAGRVSVLAGIEVDWSSRSSRQFPALLGKIDLLDYVLFEYVQDEGWHGDSLEALLRVRSAIHVPVGLAHNDLSRNMRGYTPERLVSLLQEHEVFVELSDNPLTAYYRGTDPHNVRLWHLLAESEVHLSVGSDTHGRIDDVANVRQAHRFLEERGLLDRLITNWWDPSRQTWVDQRHEVVTY